MRWNRYFQVFGRGNLARLYESFFYTANFRIKRLCVHSRQSVINTLIRSPLCITSRTPRGPLRPFHWWQQISRFRLGAGPISVDVELAVVEAYGTSWIPSYDSSDFRNYSTDGIYSAACCCSYSRHCIPSYDSSDFSELFYRRNCMYNCFQTLITILLIELYHCVYCGVSLNTEPVRILSSPIYLDRSDGVSAT